MVFFVLDAAPILQLGSHCERTKHRRIIIDPHYEENHSDINDELILELVKKLDGRTFPPVDRQDDWEFFMVDRMKHEDKLYRLVWCMQDQALFIGVINAFRR